VHHPPDSNTVILGRDDTGAGAQSRRCSDGNTSFRGVRCRCCGISFQFGSVAAGNRKPGGARGRPESPLWGNDVLHAPPRRPRLVWSCQSAVAQVTDKNGQVVSERIAAAHAPPGQLGHANPFNGKPANGLLGIMTRIEIAEPSGEKMTSWLGTLSGGAAPCDGIEQGEGDVGRRTYVADQHLTDENPIRRLRRRDCYPFGARVQAQACGTCRFRSPVLRRRKEERGDEFASWLPVAPRCTAQSAWGPIGHTVGVWVAFRQSHHETAGGAN